MKRWSHLSIALIRSLAIAVLCTTAIDAVASTITVTSTADSGAGTLRDALATATDGDTITFSLPVPATITLTTGELRVAHSVDIVGPGADKLAVDGNAAGRVFHIGSGSTVNMSGLTITHGYSNGENCPDGCGAGILNDQATLTIDQCTVSGNSAASDYGGGGGIFNNTGTVSLSNSTLTGNSAGGAPGNNAGGYGGGIFNWFGLLIITNCTFMGNAATGDYGGGGAIGNSAWGFGGGSATVLVEGSTLTGNFAGSDGGAIQNGTSYSFATVEIIHSTLSGNSAGNPGAKGYGGAIENFAYIGSANVFINSSTLSGNSATGESGWGGAILNDFVADPFTSVAPSGATLFVVNSTLSGNSAAFGGCTYNVGGKDQYFYPYAGGAHASFYSSTLSGNAATVAGGGIYNDGLPDDPGAGNSTVELASVILNGSPSGTNIVVNTDDCCSYAYSYGYTLSSDDGGGALTAATDLINTNPRLGPLQNNGGPTPTHALLAGSPAIDQGFNYSGDVNDQCGAARTVDQPSVANATDGDGTDIGAVEVQTPAHKLNSLIASVQDMGLSSGATNSLSAKLRAASRAMDRGSGQAACGVLNAFIAEVAAQGGKKQLSVVQAAQLVSEAAMIRSLLGCG
jgi:hypothetical protein